MKFSIVIPVYNAEQYIAECIDSVLNQTYQDMEIVLVDDGSTDGSGKICDQYAERYQNLVKVIHKDNQGPYIARMSGIEIATGDVLLFIDSDDCIRSDALELLSAQFQKAACDIIIFNASREKDFSMPYLELPFGNGQCFSGDRKTALFETLISTSNLNSLCLKATKKEILSAVPGEYRNFSGHNGEDLLLSLPLLTSAERIVYLDENLYYYRSRPESIVHSYNPQRHRSIKIVHLEMEKYIDKWGMEEYHPVHYAREVRGWLECLKKLLANVKKPDRQLLVELAEDDCFRKAYDKMAPGVLVWDDKLLGKLLYGKKYGHILLIGMLYRSARAAKRLVRGNGNL